jgi:hypothetical protein
MLLVGSMLKGVRYRILPVVYFFPQRGVLAL